MAPESLLVSLMGYHVRVGSGEGLAPKVTGLHQIPHQPILRRLYVFGLHTFTRSSSEKTGHRKWPWSCIILYDYYVIYSLKIRRMIILFLQTLYSLLYTLLQLYRSTLHHLL